MIGTRLESRARASRTPWILAAIAAGVALVCVVSGVYRALPLIILPLALSFVLAIARTKGPFAAVLGEEAIEVEQPAATVRYADITWISVNGSAPDPNGFDHPSRPLDVVHREGFLRIPAPLNVPTDALYRFLVAQMPVGGARSVHPTLAAYLERQEARYGPEQVHTFTARPQQRGPSGGRPLMRRAAIAFLLTAALWFAGATGGLFVQEWDLAAALAAPAGLVLLVWSFLPNFGVTPYVPNRTKSSVVVSPEGLAMVQGDIQGEVRWPELRAVRYTLEARPRGFVAEPRGIVLQLDGAKIGILDIYERPLYHIHNLILAAQAASADAPRPD